MKRLLVFAALALSLVVASASPAHAAVASPVVVPNSTIGDGGGQGVCGPWAGVAFTVTPTMYSVGLVQRYNSSGQQIGYNYRYATSRWYCTAENGQVWNFVTGGYSHFTGWAWLALDVVDFPGV